MPDVLRFVSGLTSFSFGTAPNFVPPLSHLPPHRWRFDFWVGEGAPPRSFRCVDYMRLTRTKLFRGLHSCWLKDDVIDASGISEYKWRDCNLFGAQLDLETVFRLIEYGFRQETDEEINATSGLALIAGLRLTLGCHTGSE